VAEPRNSCAMPNTRVSKGEAGADLNRLFCGEHRLFRRVGVRAGDCQCIVGIRVLLIELERLQGCIETFVDVILGRFTPAIGDDARADPSEPDMGLGQLGIEFARLSEKIPRFEVCFAPNVVKVPGALPHEVPGADVAPRAGRRDQGTESTARMATHH
jgi:hypothetical protein